MKITKLLTTFMIFMVVLFAGCKKDDYIEKIGVCFEVIATDPIDEARSVPYDQIVTATFSSKVDPTTMDESSFTLHQGSTLIEGSVAYSDSTASFTPDVALLPLTVYTGTIKMSVKDTWGNALQADYVWTFTTMPQITLIANPIIGGITSGGGAFAEGATVTVTATPLPGYTFVNWTEDGTVVSLSPMARPSGMNAPSGATEVSASSSYQFTMGAVNRTITANFAVVVLGNFAINLSSNPPAGGTTLGGGTFEENSIKTVSAVANTGYTFVNWTEAGVGVSTLPDYNFTLVGTTTLVANFQINTYTLNSSAVNGTITKNPNTPNYDYGSVVELTATPAIGYTFTSWSGDATGTVNPTNLTMNANKTVSANFTLIPTYTLSASGVNGTVAKNPNLLTYNQGDVVALTATPAIGYSFTSWSGDASGSVNPLNVTMNADKVITANFTLNALYTLTASGVNGTVTKNPVQLSYLSGSIVALTAAPAVGYVFDSWSGDASGSVNPLNVTMNADKVITANFILAGGGIGIGPGNLDLGGAAAYTILSKTGISTTGLTAITGNIGVSPNAAAGITGFGLIMDASNQFSKSSPSTLVSGNVYAANYADPTPANISTAVSDMEAAFTIGNGKVNSVITELGAGDITGMTLAPGLYKWGTGLLISASGVTLSGAANDTWIFQVGQGMTVADGAHIILAGGAQAKNIYWITASDAVIGKTVHFNGNILSQTLVSIGEGSTVTGRVLGQTAVTLNAATVILP